MRSQPYFPRRAFAHPWKRRLTIFLAFFLLAAAGFVRFRQQIEHDWVEQSAYDSGYFPPDSPCSSKIVTRLRHGMSKKDVLQIVTRNENYFVVRKPYPRGAVVEEWEVRRTDYSECISVGFDGDGRIIEIDCGNA